MLLELHVADFGVISRTHLLLPPGMTVLTGETGAGKTMLIGAIDLLTGGRSDPKSVRPGADQAVVEGRFVRPDETEVILSRVVPASGRSRAYIDGRLATAGALSELGAELVDLHGQHAHQSLLSAAIQRHALDAFGDIDLRPLVEAKAELAALEAALADLGGDPRERAREIDLYRFQVDELRAAALHEPTEEAELAVREDVLADATAHRDAGAEAMATLDGDAAGGLALTAALQVLADRAPFRAEHDRLAGLLAELDDVRAALRATTESLEDDPGQLAEVRARRQLLRELMRKYGSDLGEVITYQATAEARLADLESHDDRAVELDGRRIAALAKLEAAQKKVGKARVAAAPKLAAAVESHLHELAMAKARFDVAVDGPAGEHVVFGLAANPGAPVLPLSKVASGGELARSMLAFRQVLTGAPATLVFDEVDAGIGGEVAHAVGRSLACLSDRHQVLVVTHLAQVAAYADQQVQVRKSDDGTTTSTTFEPLSADQRVVELSRMLSGSPDSSVAQAHAEELLAAAGRGRGEAR
ncbi:MAG: DNA repair protein RecN [Acidimicrobiales bacterium]|nr:DNA repair protein RecN [Acidimicrobiales bacterium]